LTKKLENLVEENDLIEQFLIQQNKVYKGNKVTNEKLIEDIVSS